MITSKQQSLDKEGLKKLLEDKESTLTSLKKINFEDVTKPEERTDKKTGEKKIYQVISKKSEFRVFLENIGVSNLTKNVVIKAVKTAEVDLNKDIALINALIAIK